jgi:hypothetical protein
MQPKYRQKRFRAAEVPTCPTARRGPSPAVAGTAVVGHVAPRGVLAFQVLPCPRCAGPRRILGAVTEPHAARRLLTALRLVAEPPPGRPVPAA